MVSDGFITNYTKKAELIVNLQANDLDSGRPVKIVDNNITLHIKTEWLRDGTNHYARDKF